MLDEPEVDLDGAESRERMSLPPRPKNACNEGAKERYHKIVQYKKQMKITSTGGMMALFRPIFPKP